MTWLVRALPSVVLIAIVLAGVVTFAPSSLIACRRNANESAAIVTLKAVHHAQTQLRERGTIDSDGDGVGEFGTLAELSAIVGLRDGSGLLDPPLLASWFDSRPAGVVIRSGYVFQMWLPAAANDGFVPEQPGGGVEPAAVDPDRSETIWRCYAWPLSREAGKRVFAIDQSGEVLGARNHRHWDGTWRRPTPDTAALSSSELLRLTWLSSGEMDARGTTWVLVN